MVKVSPRTLVAKIPRGESGEFDIRLSDLSAGTVTVAVTGGSASISVQQLVAFREERRPATEAEIAELPAFPPSIRERLRREGIVETVESERVDGDAPIHVERGGALVATLQIEPLPKTARSRVNAGVTRVGFTGAGVDPIEVPVTVLTDRSEMPVTPVPERIVCAARPGEVTRKEVSVWKAPAGTIVAWIDTASASIRLQSLVVQQQVQMWFTEEELAEMPPALREKARRNGYVVFEEMGRAGAGDPVVVPQAAVVSAYVEFAPFLGCRRTGERHVDHRFEHMAPDRGAAVRGTWQHRGEVQSRVADDPPGRTRDDRRFDSVDRRTRHRPGAEDRFRRRPLDRRAGVDPRTARRVDDGSARHRRRRRRLGGRASR